MTKEESSSRTEAIGNRIKQLRISSGYSSHETFANAKGFSRKGYWSLEKGKNFTISTLLKIVDVHGITLEQFFKGIK